MTKTNNMATVNPSGARQRFCAARFFKVASLYLGENARFLLLSAITLLALLTALSIITAVEQPYDSYTDPHGQDISWRFETMFIFAGIIISGIVSGSMMFSGLGDKEQRVSMLTLPATTSEKFWIRFIIYVPLFIIVFFLCAYIADIIRVIVVSTCMKHQGTVSVMPLSYMLSFGEWNTYWGTANMIAEQEQKNMAAISTIIHNYQIILILSAFFALGSAFFPKKALVKTSVGLFSIGMLGALITAGSTLLFFGGGITRSVNPVFPGVSPWGMNVIEVCLLILVLAGIYGLAYARIRESEVIDRW